MVKDKNGNALSFDKANYKVEEVFSLDRLSDEELMPSYEKLSNEDKEAIVEALKDQSSDKDNTVEEVIQTIESLEQEGNEHNEFMSNILESMEPTKTKLRFKRKRNKTVNNGTSLEKNSIENTVENTISNIDKSKTVQSEVDKKTRDCRNPKA